MDVWREWRGKGDRRLPEVVVRADSDGGFDAESLMVFAMAARIDLLAQRTFEVDTRQWVPASPDKCFNRAAMARMLGMSPSKLSGLVGKRGLRRDRSNVLDLEHRLASFAFHHRGADAPGIRELGWLTSFYEELGLGPTGVRKAAARAMDGIERMIGEHESSGMWPLARWYADLCEGGPNNAAEALVLGEALVALFDVWGKFQDVAALFPDAAERTMRALVSVACKPPGAGAVPAIQLAAQIGPRVLDIVDEHVMRSGVGFRATRIATRIAYLLRTGAPPWWPADPSETADRLQRTVAVVLSDELPDPYPARSFGIELLREVGRLARHLNDESWAADTAGALRHRMLDAGRPVRERGYAIYTLAELEPSAVPDLLSLCATLASDDPAWSFVALTLDRRAPDDLFLGGTNPFIGRVEDRVVYSHLASAGKSDGGMAFMTRLPSSVRGAAGSLLRYALLSPDGTARRRACEALRESGVAAEAAMVAVAVLTDEKSPRWLQEQAAFIAGYLESDRAVPGLVEVARDSSRHASVRHAALFAIGDLRMRSDDAVQAALECERESQPVEVRRAAMYALAALRPQGDFAKLDAATGNAYYQEQRARMSARLNNDDEDTTIRRLAEWGLETTTRDLHRREHQASTLLWGVDPLPERPAPRIG